MLRDDMNRFSWDYEVHMCGGNTLWADPTEAVRVGEEVGNELVGRFAQPVSPDNAPSMPSYAHDVLGAALELVNYAALPAERRANILRGVINSLEASGALGGEPEWATIADTSTQEPASPQP